MPENKVDINHADRDLIRSITGLSEKNVNSIYEYRRANGDFENVEEIHHVPGIDVASMEKIRNKVFISTRTETDKIDLNHARPEELKQLPNVGDSGAEAIVNYRKTHGEFKSFDDVDNISGVGSFVLESLKKNAHL